MARVRFRGHRNRVDARGRCVHRPARPARAACAATDFAGAIDARGGRRPAHGIAGHGLDRRPHGARALRISGHVHETVRRDRTRDLRQSWRVAVHAVPSDDGGRLARHCPRRHGAVAVCLDLLRRLPAHRDVHGVEPVHRSGRQCDAVAGHRRPQG